MECFKPSSIDYDPYADSRDYDREKPYLSVLYNNAYYKEITYLSKKKQGICWQLGNASLVILSALSIIPLIINLKGIQIRWKQAISGREVKVVLMAQEKLNQKPSKKSKPPGKVPANTAATNVNQPNIQNNVQQNSTEKYFKDIECCTIKDVEDINLAWKKKHHEPKKKTLLKKEKQKIIENATEDWKNSNKWPELPKEEKDPKKEKNKMRKTTVFKDEVQQRVFRKADDEIKLEKEIEKEEDKHREEEAAIAEAQEKENAKKLEASLEELAAYERAEAEEEAKAERAKEEEEARVKAEMEKRDKAEAERIKAENERVKTERAKAEQERAQAEEEERAKAEKEKKAKAEEEAKAQAKVEAEARAKIEAEIRAQIQAEIEIKNKAEVARIEANAAEERRVLPSDAVKQDEASDEEVQQQEQYASFDDQKVGIPTIVIRKPPPLPSSPSPRVRPNGTPNASDGHAVPPLPVEVSPASGSNHATSSSTPSIGQDSNRSSKREELKTVVATQGSLANAFKRARKKNGSIRVKLEERKNK